MSTEFENLRERISDTSTMVGSVPNIKCTLDLPILDLPSHSSFALIASSTLCEIASGSTRCYARARSLLDNEHLPVAGLLMPSR